MAIKSIMRNKVVIVGSGNVGATTAYTLMISGRATEIVLIDINKEKTEGEVMDLNHGMAFTDPATIYAGDYNDCKDADIIIITAGANQKPGETRLDLVYKNTEIFKEIIGNIISVEKNAVLLVVTNPVDILTYVSLKVSGLSQNQVIGSGTVLDTARFKYSISSHCGIDPRNIHGYIIGEHGDTEVAVWSRLTIGGNNIESFCELCDHKCGKETKKMIFQDVKNAAYEIINRKGATYYAVSLGVLRIVEAILRNESSILTISSYLDGYLGIDDVCLSVPTIVSRKGRARIIPLTLNNDEFAAFKESAEQIKNIISKLNI